MKILILLKKYEGGVGVVINNIEKELKKKGHKVKIISRQNDLKINSFSGSIFKSRKTIKKQDKKENYDIIYTQDWSLAFPLLFPFPILKKKHFCCFHGEQPWFPSKLFQKVVGKIMGRKIIVIGDSLKKMFPKSNLIFNGVRLDIFKPNKKIKRIKNSVGFANWKNDIYKYKEIKKAVEETGKKLIVAENIPHKKMPDFYNKIETFISLPPLYTSCALVWLEAISCNVPKVIGNCAGIRFPINYIEDFKSIKDIILNAKKKDAKNFPFKKFTWDYHTNKLINLWKKK